MTEANAEALFQVQCKTCHATVVTGAVDFHAALKCDCCPQGRDHDHKASAQACSGSSDIPGPVGHDEPCPFPSNGLYCHATPPGLPCDGGHCGPGVKGCTVCRPIVITPIPGTVTVTGA